MKKRALTLLLVLMVTVMIGFGCRNETVRPKKIVEISEYDNHYEVTIDYSTGMSHREVAQLGI